MSEHKIPIPSRLYNAAVDGHVAGADQIIDDKTSLTLDKVAGGALEEKEYISSSNNGMGRVILRKNLVEGVNTLTQNMINKSNTIYIIQYDFTLGEDITVPYDCILEFDGGSISGEHTITGNNTIINADIIKIFNTDITLSGTWQIHEAYPEWFGAKGNNISDDTTFIQKCIDSFYNIKLLGYYIISKTLLIKRSCTNIIGNNKQRARITKTVKEAEDVDAIFYVKADSENINNVVISNLQLVSYSNSRVDYAIKAENITYSKISNLRVDTFTIGISISNGWIDEVSNCDMFSIGGKGLDIINVNPIYIEHCFASGYAGAFFNNCNGTLISCDFENGNACYDVTNSTIDILHGRTETFNIAVKANNSKVKLIGGYYEIHFSNTTPISFIQATDSEVYLYGTVFKYEDYEGYPGASANQSLISLTNSILVSDFDFDMSITNFKSYSLDENSTFYMKTKIVKLRGVNGKVVKSFTLTQAKTEITRFPYAYRKDVDFIIKGKLTYYDALWNIDADCYAYNEGNNIVLNDRTSTIVSQGNANLSITVEKVGEELIVYLNNTNSEVSARGVVSIEYNLTGYAYS